MTITTSEYSRAVVPSVNKATVLSRTFTLVGRSEVTADGCRCICAGTDFTFSLPFPTYIDGRTTPLPPSYTAIHPGATTEMSYYLQVDIARKGFFRRHEV